MLRLLLATATGLAISASAATGDDETAEKKPIAPGPWNFGATVGLNLAQSAFSSLGLSYALF